MVRFAIVGGAVSSVPVAARVLRRWGVESFNSRFRHELLNQESFADLAEARQVSAWWQSHYNHRRPHSPARFAASLGEPPLQLGAKPLAYAPARPAIESATHQPTLTTAGT